ncbi:MAG: ASCH domain-containing protein [Thermoprotei archaeon]|nr:MAG: ASCH domain-containing protein [Thermoprotei archaeon]
MANEKWSTKEKSVRRRKIGGLLMFSKDYAEDIESGKKKTTIRLGILTPSRRKVTIMSGGKVIGKAVIESVEYTKVKNLTDKDAKLDGFKSREALISALRKHYPGIDKEDWVTIIRFSLEKDENKTGSDSADPVSLARLGLAFNVFNNALERRILAALVSGKSTIETAKEFGVGEDKIMDILRKVKSELRKKGVLRQ